MGLKGKVPPFRGSGVALATPFSGGLVDYPALERLISFHIDHQTDALVICATTGEGSTLSRQERSEIVRFTVEHVNHRIPVIVGTGSNVTSASVEMSMDAEKQGADGLLLVTPYYNKTSQAGLVQHFKRIAECTTLPCILYNVPSRTGMSIALDTYVELSRVPNIVATKEASGNLELAEGIIKKCGEDLFVYSGEDRLNVPLALRGAVGCISVLADIVPEEVHAMMTCGMNGEAEMALHMQSYFQRLIDALFVEVNPIPVKKALNLMGFCTGELRMPLVELSSIQQEQLASVLAEYKLL